MIPASLAILAAYLVGSLPFGYLTARVAAGIDIRSQGSGNIGATNVARVVGAKWGALVLMLDCLKGLLPVWLLPEAAHALTEQSLAIPHLRVACAVATILGHMYPCWLGFRGGKGVATALGVVLVLGPWASLTALATFLVCIATFRIVSLSSIFAAVAFAIVQIAWLFPEPFSQENWSLTVFSLAVPLLIIARHRDNIVRLLRGQEAKFHMARKQKSEPSDDRGPTANAETR
jgi:acyl phosphate:glycerol-3-phosphate acyltransferase